ncbi:MAG TPA: ATP-binding protein [Burkholderiales bacterium]|nr:ATP-binding protein [Burkholderiales bacterium]
MLTALFCAGAVAATGLALWQMRSSEIDASARHLAHLARGLAEQTAREIVDTDQDLLRIVGGARIRPERLLAEPTRAEVLNRNVTAITQAAALAFVDPAGHRHEYVRPSAPPPGFPAPTSADGLIVRDGSDRTGTGLFLQRTLALRDGTAAGVLLLRLSEDYLGDIFRAWRGDSTAATALTTAQGRSLLLSPVVIGAAGKPLAALAGAVSGARLIDSVVRYVDPVDGRSYILASEPVPDTPLVVHAWISERDVLTSWLEQAALLAGTTIALTLIALAFARRHAMELARRAGAIGRLSDLQSALAAGEAQLQMIVRTVPSAVFQARVAGRGAVELAFMSAQIETLAGVTAEEAVRRPRRALRKVPRAHRRQLVESIAEAVATGSGWDVTVPISEGQTSRWLRVHAAPAAQEDAFAVVWDGLVSDVTEQKLAERQVVLLNLDLERRVVERTQELADLNKELEAFTDSVSHDLRAPLRGMRGYAEIIRSGPELPGEAAALLDRVIAQGEHMEQLIEALLELSQLSRSELRRTGVDLSEIANATLDELAARDAGRTVRWTVQPGLRANADPRLMRVLFENLLGNAWKFTRERAEAAIAVGSQSQRAGRTVYYVRDNGAGFDPEYAERLFRPFQRLHPASRFEGTGIGLATVQRIIRRHGGRIWAESTPGEGATFYFELPVESYTRAP